MSTLSVELQILLELRFTRGCTWNEIGIALGVLPTAAKRRYQRAQLKLHAIILCEVYLLPEPERGRALKILFRETDPHGYPILERRHAQIDATP